MQKCKLCKYVECNDTSFFRLMNNVTPRNIATQVEF